MMNIPNDIDAFLESILYEANLVTLDENMRQELKKELFDQLDNYLASVIVDKLAPEDLERFIEMSQEQRPKEEIELFINEKIPHPQEFFANAFVRFKAMYLENLKIAKT
jgi:hypothetical protein